MRTLLLTGASLFLIAGLLACGGGTTADNDAGDGSTPVGDSTMPMMDTGPVGDGSPTDGTVNDSGLPPTNPGKVDCGMMTCNAGTETCCIRVADGGAMYACVMPPADGGMLQCQGARLNCDEAADCMMGQICCGGVQNMTFGTRCTSMGCGMTGVQVCKTSQECGMNGNCQTWTCPFIGKITSCTKPFGQCM